MNNFFKIISVISLCVLLGGCLASTTSPSGINCDSKTEVGPYWDWPLVCQPGGGG